MNLVALQKLIEPNLDKEGMCALNTWLLTTTLCRMEAVELDAHLEFALVARQMAWADFETGRIHVQYSTPHLLTVLHQVSVPGTIRVMGKSISSQRGICYVKANASMAVLDRLEGLASPCFVASQEESKLFVRREDVECDSSAFADYGRAMQVVGALIHLAVDSGEMTFKAQVAEKLLAQLEEHYRLVFGCKIQHAQRFLDLACEYAMWEAAKRVLVGAEVAELVCGAKECV